MKYYGNEKEGISLTESMHTLPTKDRVALVEVVQVPDTQTPEQLEGARRYATFMHAHLPENSKTRPSWSWLALMCWSTSLCACSSRQS